MSLLALALIVMAALTAGYLLYGSFIARQYRLDDARTTPATARNDGVDFVPTRPFYLMAQHFSAIAAAGPIVGPIAACLAFGWLPCVLWICIGVIFIGAVHDFSALVASIRHGAHSIADIARENISRRAWLALTAFIWLALIYVITAFTDVTAQTFVGISDELLAAPGGFNKGGAVALASTQYLAIALIMGVVQRALRPPMWAMTIIFVPATLLAVALGARLDHLLNFEDVRTWYFAILAYCFIASLLPMWLLQQPRGYLGGFILYIAIAVGLAGVLLGGFTIEQPALRPLADYSAFLSGAVGPDGKPVSPILGLIFPFLFVTIACGACSGFHGLVCGGTTSKQIAKESHCRAIGFGAMLLEGLVAVVALSTVMIMADADRAGRAPGVIYGDGLATFVARLLDPGALTARDSPIFIFAATFGAMAFSTFVFDTLDVSTRLGRYLLTELFGASGLAAGITASAVTAGVPLAILLTADKGSYMQFWTLFGTSNQLLAGLTLLGVTVWLRRQGRRSWYTLLPMLFVMTITILALTMQVFDGIRGVVTAVSRDDSRFLDALRTPGALNAAVGIALLGFAAMFVWEVAKVWRAHAAPPRSAA